MVNPDLIRTFLTLAETRHFTRASERLAMTQPGVSQHLQKLEAYFGTPLVHRRGKSFTLTEAGKRLVAYGQRLFDDHRRFQEGIAGDDPRAGALRFASPGAFGAKIFDVLLAEAKKCPGLQVDVTIAPNSSIVRHLREERIDVGFMGEEPRDPEVEATLFGKIEVLLALPKGRRVTSLAQLAELGFVNHPDGFHYAERLLALNFPDEFEGMARVPVRVFINQSNRILDPVAEGIGFACLPETTIERYHRRRDIHAVRLRRRVEDPLYKVVRRGERLPARYARVLELLAK